MFCPRLCMCAACPWSAYRGQKITLDPLVLVTECWAARLMLWPELTFLQQHQGLLTLDYHFSSPQRFWFFVLGMELGCGACYIKPVLLSIPSEKASRLFRYLSWFLLYWDKVSCSPSSVWQKTTSTFCFDYTASQAPGLQVWATISGQGLWNLHCIKYFA